MPSKYLGAFSDSGFISPLHLQIGAELQKKLPKLFGKYNIGKFWGYKYDTALGGGIGIHADFAYLNLNFWITPDKYNNEKSRGGLKVYDVPAPEDWSFNKYNNNTEEIYNFLKEKKALNHYLYTAIGNEGMPMRPYYDDMIAGIKAHKPKGLRWVNNAFSDVPHNLVSAAGIFNAYHNLFYSEYMQPKDFNGELSSIADYYSRLNAQRGSNFKAPEWVIRELGYHFVTKGDFEQAIKVFKYGISRYPNMPDAYNGLAYGYEQAGQLKASLVEVNKALKLAPKSHDGYQVYYNRQQRLLKQLSGS